MKLFITDKDQIIKILSYLLKVDDIEIIKCTLESLIDKLSEE